MFECVINISEGANASVLAALIENSGPSLRDVHSDAVHNRSVFTFINEDQQLLVDVRNYITSCYQHLSLGGHEGVHPRFGVVDVVPFVALDENKASEAVQMRNETAAWLSETFAVPVFLYGSSRSLPEVRRTAFTSLHPDFGPMEPHPLFGAVAMGERPVLVAWNIWLRDCTIERARILTSEVRTEHVRSLAFAIGDYVQVSCNLIAPRITKPSDVYDKVQSLLANSEIIDHCELVGLCPEYVLSNESPSRITELGLSVEKTIEARCS